MSQNLPDTTIDPEVLNGFIEESLEGLNSLDTLFLQLEKTPDDISPIHNIFRAVHSLKGNAPFFGFFKIKALAHDLESLLALVRDGSIRTSAPLITHLLACIDKFKVMLTRLQQGGPELVDTSKYNSLLERTQKYIKEKDSIALEQNVVPKVDHTKSATTQEPTTNNTAQNVAKSIRISEERIDTFLGFVGEMIIVSEMLRHLTVRLQTSEIEHEILRDFTSINHTFSQLSNGLENAIMAIRKVPVKPLLQKVPRLVRDIAQAKGKQISVEIVGDNTEIDKSLMELLDAPLTHMVRNAADHGIESSEKRLLAGKSATGTIKVRCQEDPKFFILEIEDDGAGLNYDGLKKKAVSLGLVKPDHTMTESEIINLLFMAGVSTAAEVSDISGRGVGMDVVKRSIESAGGSISVKSVANKGSIFTVKLIKSVTTQIIQGYVVKIADNFYVLPLEKVRESWKLDPDHISKIFDHVECVQRHNKTIPLIDLDRVLNSESKNHTYEDKLGITVALQENNVAFLVDKIIGTRQLVLKTIDELALNDKFFLGGALLGDGSIALVLDIDKLNTSIPVNLIN